MLWFQLESLGLSVPSPQARHSALHPSGAGRGWSVSPMTSTSASPTSPSVKRGNQDKSKHFVPYLLCRPTKNAAQQSPEHAQSIFPPPQLPRTCTAPALISTSFYPEKSNHVTLSHSPGCHCPHSWGLVWLSRAFPISLHNLAHPATLTVFLRFQPGFHEVLPFQDFITDTGMTVKVQAPKSSSTAVKNDILHKTSIINRGSLWTAATECIQSCQASILLWNHNLLGSFAFFFPSRLSILRWNM